MKMSAFTKRESGNLTETPINLLSDIMFKSLFGREHKENMEALLSDLFGYSVFIIEYLNVEQSINNLDKKGTRLDLLVSLVSGATVNVEVQVRRQEFYLERIQLYWAKEFASQYTFDTNYSDLKKVYSVSILQNSFFDDDRAHRRIVLKDDETNEVYDGSQEYHFLETAKISCGTLQDWVSLLNGRKNELSSDRTRRIYKEAEVMLTDEQTRRLYEAEQKAHIDAINADLTATRLGIKEGRAEIVKSMFVNGMSAEDISKATGLSLEDVMMLVK